MIETIITRAPQGGDSGGGSWFLHLSGDSNKQAETDRDSILPIQIAVALVIGASVFFGIPLACGVLCNLLGVG